MPKLGELAHDKAKLIVKAPSGAEVTVIYRPSRITGKAVTLWERTIRGGKEAEDEFVEWLQGTVIDWDVLDDSDQPLPLTVDTIASLPTKFVQLFIGGIMADSGEPVGLLGTPTVPEEKSGS